MAKKKSKAKYKAIPAPFATPPVVYIRIFEPSPTGSVPGGGDVTIKFVCRRPSWTELMVLVYDTSDGTERTSSLVSASCPRGEHTETLPAEANKRFIIRLVIIDPSTDEILASDDTLVDT